MKTFLSKVLFIAVLGIFIAAFASCGKCDDIKTTESAKIVVNDSASIKLNSAIVLEIQEIISKKMGDRKCWKKNLITCWNDELFSDRLSVGCTKDLKLRKETILAGKNLMDLIAIDSAEYSLGITNYLVIKLPLSDSFAIGKYTFILGGTTKNGKPLNDTLTISY